MSSRRILTLKSANERPNTFWASKPFIVRIESNWYKVVDINVLDFLITLEELTDQEFLDLVLSSV